MANYGKTPAEYQAAQIGAYGLCYHGTTDAVTGNFWRVEILTDTIFTTNTIESGAAQAFGGATMPVGAVFIGDFTVIDIASGSLVATYNGNT